MTPDELDELKRRSPLQLLFKAARLGNEEAVRRAQAAAWGGRLRIAHTALFPHVPFDGIRLTELAQKLGITKQAVQQLVDELEQMGVFERLPDPLDGRAKLIRWSAKGREQIAHGLGIFGELELELSRELGGVRWEEFRRSLQAVIEFLDREA